MADPGVETGSNWSGHYVVVKGAGVVGIQPTPPTLLPNLDEDCVSGRAPLSSRAQGSAGKKQGTFLVNFPTTFQQPSNVSLKVEWIRKR